MSYQQTPQGPVFGPNQQIAVIGFPQSEKPGGFAVFMGIVTMLVSIVLVILSLVGAFAVLGAAEDEGIYLGLLLGCVPLLFALYGIFSGAMLAFVGGSAGKVFASIFWVLLLGGGICGCLFGGLIFSGPGLFG
jgi:hypothetical protein